ncbi:MAG: GIY-YIG nuclease family protein [Candidatus Saccharimonadales bacterium]
MYYAYILRSMTTQAYYYGSTTDMKARLTAHNSGKNVSTKKYRPWEVAWYGAFESRETAQHFETYLKTASGKAFLRKRLL